MAYRIKKSDFSEIFKRLLTIYFLNLVHCSWLRARCRAGPDVFKLKVGFAGAPLRDETVVFDARIFFLGCSDQYGS